MRPVFSRSGRPAVVSLRSAGISGAMKRALRSLVKKPPSAKNRRCGSASPRPRRPLHRRHRVERLVRQRLQRADIEIAAAVVLERRQRRVFAKHVRRRVEIERRAKAEPFCHFADDPPIRLGLSRRRRGTRAAARSAVPNWSPCRISRPRPAPAAAHARRRSRCRWSAHSPRPRTARVSSARRARRRRPAATPPDWCRSPTAP